MRIIKVKKGQSVFDVAIQEYGSLYGAHWIMEDNNLNSVLDNLYEGDEVLIREDVINGQVKNYLIPFDIATIDDAARACGIGFWAIEVDFEVQ